MREIADKLDRVHCALIEEATDCDDIATGAKGRGIEALIPPPAKPAGKKSSAKRSA